MIIKNAILGISMTSGLAYQATDLADKIFSAANSTVAVYEAAGDILGVGYLPDENAEARMYQSAAGLQPIVDDYYNGTLMPSKAVF